MRRHFSRLALPRFRPLVRGRGHRSAMSLPGSDSWVDDKDLDSVSVFQAMPTAALAGLAVLIVEDEPLLRRQLAAQLERLGADVTLAGTLATARKFITDLPLDF